MEIRISLLGEVRVKHVPTIQSAPTRVPQSVAGLLAFVLLNRERSVSRSTLIDVFWANYTPDRARACANTAVWRLRQLLEPRGIPRGAYLIGCTAGDICFNTASPHRIDIYDLESMLQRLLATDPKTLSMEQVAESMHVLGKNLPGFLEGHFDDWVLRFREQLRTLHIASLAHLMDNFRFKGATQTVLELGQRILALDPLREDVHRAVMRSLDALGHRALAMKQFEKCQELLLRELSVPPMQETVNLYRAIAAQEPLDPRAKASFSVTPSRQSPVIQHALSELRAAAQHIEHSLQLLMQAQAPEP